MDDEKIVALYLERNESALNETASKYGARLRRISLGIVGDDPTAEECENDTYLEAWNSIPPHEPRSYLFAFLARIIRSISLDVCRSRNRLKRSADITEFTAEMEECIPSPDDTACKIEYKELGEAISRYLHTLSEEKQIIFVRRYWYLDSVAEIAQKLSVSRSKVKMTLFRCRAELREFLIKDGYSV